ncbi:proline-rich putative variable surface lipoprotein [[Mycoplasma] phocae]|uniref:Proline-rich putative variable surface lipoprotein n=1 Tax=[Mycoplasma] phocae TaxID=142651 RepID=A0A2Z5IPX3_9BACT|nr:proline-rich putative variable surface lipoprotein [[Mycoplasma] phocae]
MDKSEFIEAGRQQKELEEQKLRNTIIFTYQNSIDAKASNYDSKQIKLEKNDGFSIDHSKSEVNIKSEAISSIFPNIKNYAIAKLTLTKGTKSFDFYVKFEVEKTNSKGLQVDKSEFIEAKKQQKELENQKLRNAILMVKNLINEIETIDLVKKFTEELNKAISYKDIYNLKEKVEAQIIKEKAKITNKLS